MGFARLLFRLPVGDVNMLLLGEGLDDEENGDSDGARRRVRGGWVSALGHVDTWVASASDTYAGASITVWPAGLVLRGAGALGCVVASLSEAVELARR